MKLDDKIKIKRVAYLLKGEQFTALELALLYYILATRRTSENKIADSCLKSIQWIKKAGIEVPDNISQLEPSNQLELIEKLLVNNKAMICQPVKAAVADSLVHAIPAMGRDLGLAYIN